MKNTFKFSCVVVMLPTIVILLCSFFKPVNNKPSYHFPYKQAGLTEKQAAAHLLSRFTYGASPKQVESVVNIGLENWFLQQLNGDIPDDTLNQHLGRYKILQLSNTEIVNRYPRAGQVLRMAIKDGVIDKDSINKANKKDYKNQLKAYMQQKKSEAVTRAN